MKIIFEKLCSLGFVGVIKKIFYLMMGFEPSFNCAIRYKSECFSSLVENKEEFISMSYSTQYWCADPFIFVYDEKTFVFTEVYDRRKKRGFIGCSEVLNGKISEPVPVIVEKYHMSFPMIFKFRDNYFMIPETEQGNCISIYICNNSPYSWRLFQKIDINIHLVDCIVYKIEENCIYLLGSEYSDVDPKKCKYIKLSLEYNDEKFKLIFDNDFNNEQTFGYDNRNAGLISSNIYCAQRSTKMIYGYSLLLNDISLDSSKMKKKTKSIEVKPSDLNILFEKNYKIRGVHTYNSSDIYEVIDFEYYDSKYFRKLRR